MKWRTSKVVPAYAVTTASLEQKKGYWVKRFSKNLWGRVVKGVKSPGTYVEVICALLIILFIYTGLNKMMDYENFKFQLGRSPYLQNLSSFIATTLPAGELLVAVSLINRRTRLIGLYASYFLMLLFTGYIWIMLNESYYLPCSCGGILAIMTWEDHFIFNTIFTLLSIIAIFLQWKKIGPKQIKSKK